MASPVSQEETGTPHMVISKWHDVVVPFLVESPQEAWQSIFTGDCGSVWHTVTPAGTELMKYVTAIPASEPPQVSFPETCASGDTAEVIRTVSPGNSVMKIRFSEERRKVFMMLDAMLAPLLGFFPQEYQIIQRSVKPGFPRADATTPFPTPLHGRVALACILMFDAQSSPMQCITCMEVSYKSC
eukprot:TRINITY_DN76361_c0_g1_i1.p1 TRINITY_DN76361_c0_g1~~TRINITY_DN76361_c0_g1_i1.p1  ORF type:complete len:185 (-),score=27.22 TRINITY_DN76361_c0_g1_i1:122-676(-)